MFRRLIDSPWTYFVLAGVLALVALGSQFRLHLPTRPERSADAIETLRERDDLNVLFVLIDTLRADRMGSYGYERDTSPIMDRLAETGIRFEHVEAQSSWTKTSMASIWTGNYASRHGILHFSHAMPQEARMPAEVFKEEGFFTGGVFRNGWVEANFGFSQGFDLYVKPALVTTRERYRHKTPSSHPLQGTDANATIAAREFLRAHAEERFFLYVHYMDAHQYLYDEESALFGSSYSDAYDNAIHWTDRNIGMLYEELEKQGVLDETVVVITSDHGEAFREHGTEGHAKNLYREVTEVPLIVTLPFRIEGGIEVEETVATLDIFPTLFELIGLPPLEGTAGRSLMPLIGRAAADGAGAVGSEAESADRTVFAALDRAWAKKAQDPKVLFSMVREPYRYIYRPGRPESDELYDRSEDPMEQNDIAEERPEVRADFREAMEEHIARGEREKASVPQVELTEMRRKQLEALGYAVEGREEEED